MLPTLALAIVLAASGDPAPVDLLHQSIAGYEALESNPVPARSDYRVAWAELDGEAPPEAIVLMEGPAWCGSGGCTLTVWRQGPGGGFRHVSRSSLCRDEVRLSGSRSYGWLDLVVRVSGGGREPAWHVLRFNGNAYALNPSIEPLYDGDPEALEPVSFDAGD